MSVKANHNRIVWADIMRGIAIILVLLAHYNGDELSTFAARSCVQIFFFLSGMFAFCGKYSFKEYAKKQCNSILVPYVLFAVINLIFHFAFNPHTPLSELSSHAVNFLLARRSETLVAAMWFLPCLFFTSVVYKLINDLLKKQIYILPVCFAISAVFKIFFESPVSVFSLNQGLKYMIYMAIGNALYPYLKDIDLAFFTKLDIRWKVAVGCMFAFECWYVYLFYTRGYVFWPQPIWQLAVVSFINTLVIIDFTFVISLLLAKVKPLAWIGQNTLGFCCMENINRALLNTAMAFVGFGFIPDNEIKALVHTAAAMCIGAVIIFVINKLCPQLLGKKKLK